MQLDLIGSAIAFFQEQQRAFHDSLATDLHAVHDTGGWLPALSLIGIGFLYGIFHAIGPGHGKLVVTSYMLANNSSLKRGIVIVVLSSLLQGIVAIALVLGAFYLLGLARETAEQATAILECISFALIALVGIGLFMRGLREVRQLLKAKQHHDNHGHHEHGHGCSHCGHAHMPSPQDLGRAKGIWPLALMIVSIGIRPCSGAVIMLLFACLIGAVVPGMIATMAMAVGTGVTTAALAIAAMQSKKAILKAMQSSDRALAVTHAALGIVGGLLVTLLGIIFLIAGVELARQQAATAPAVPAAMPLMHLPVKSPN